MQWILLTDLDSSGNLLPQQSTETVGNTTGTSTINYLACLFFGEKNIDDRKCFFIVHCANTKK
jgi:hypothetical protein